MRDSSAPGRLPRHADRACRRAAGYGKSTLLAEWATRDSRPFAWVSLEPDAAEDGIREAAELVDEAAPRVVVVDDAQLADEASLRQLVEAR